MERASGNDDKDARLAHVALTVAIFKGATATPLFNCFRASWGRDNFSHNPTYTTTLILAQPSH